MPQADRTRSVVRRIASAVHQIDHTDQVVTTTERSLAELRAAVDALQATTEASFKGQLEALSFLTRSINDLSARLAKLELIGDDTEG